ncbi:hypothetical protein Acr_16g0010310 [Actinidia rufa]|uniref:Uncharacterized protein n=1 Tax=Actinidia rufa TaxID=165716 RepID=A0A7J0G0U4_9ERIC|nr:hypothetical protein Acr_16g0010310 [Actinidia rufa]
MLNIDHKKHRRHDSCYFPAGIQMRLPEAEETTTSTRPGEVAFYEAAFRAGLHLPIHPTLRRILAFYNAFLKSFALNSGAKASSSGDNAEEKNTGDAAHTAYEVESHHFQGDPPRGDHFRDDLMDDIDKDGPEEARPIGESEGRPEKGSGRRDLDQSRSSLGFEAFAINNPDVAEKLLQGVVLPTDKETVDKLDLDMAATQFFHAISQIVEMTRAQRMAKDLESKVVELEAEKHRSDAAVVVIGKELEELKKFKEEYDVAIEKHEKEMAEIRKREVIAKMLAVDKFKASDEYKEIVEGAASSHFGEGFFLCKKQINLLYPDLDINDLQSDPNLVNEDEDEEEGKVVQDATLP